MKVFSIPGCFVIHCLLLLCILARSAPAATKVWDISPGDGSTITDGDGTWSNGGGNWNDGSGDATWNNTTPDSAIFTGTVGGTISVSSGVIQAGMVFNGNANHTLNNGGIGGTGGLTQNGTGTLTLSGANSFSGGTTVSQGALTYETYHTMGTGPITLGDANTGANDITLTYDFASTGWGAVMPDVRIADAGSGTVTISLPAQNHFMDGNVILDRSAIFTANAAVGGAYIAASAGDKVTGNPAGGILTLQSTGAGALYMGNGGANDFVATVAIPQGRVSLFNPGALGSGNPVIMSGTGILDLRNHSQTIGDLSGAASNSIILGSGTLTLISSHPATFVGTITGTGGLIKTGTGTQTLSGTNTYSGPTTVNGGGLIIDGSLTASALTIASGTLGGAGTLGASLAMQTGSTLKPGGDMIGTLTVNHSMILAGAVHLEIAKSGPSLTCDRIAGSGALNLSGTLTVTATGDVLAVGDTFTLFANTGGLAGSLSAPSAMPPLPAGLFWDVSSLLVDGTITVVDVPGAPVFSPPSGTYIGTPAITITADPGTTIHYTVDGTEPSAGSPQGPSPLTLVLPADVTDYTIKAIASMAGANDSPVNTATYSTIGNPGIRINEVLAVSTDASLPLDENGLRQDWIELRNDRLQPLSLAGWTLTDNPDIPDKWTFPVTAVIPAGGYYLIFASGTGTTPTGGTPHATFSLAQDGERLQLIRPDGVVASEADYPVQYPNVTWGTRGGGIETGFLRTATPGAFNSQLAAAGSNTVTFSVPHGFKTATFPLALSATLPGSVIRYTLDGTQPTAASTIYSAPLQITPIAGTVKSGTRIVRAIATHADAACTPVATQTYLFVNGVTAPDTDGIVGQTNFVAAIKNHATYGPLIDDAILALPALSIVNGSSGLPYDETASSMELFDPAGAEPGFTIPAGLSRTGTTSINFAKGSMSARFRGEYGATSLNYPVFGNHPYDSLGAATGFEELRIRSGSHDSHHFLGTATDPFIPYRSITRSGDAQYIRNIWIEDMQFLMGQPGRHGRLVNLFFNGNYYGIYHIQERPDDHFMGSYFPGGSDDYHSTVGARKGSTHDTESWTTPWQQMKDSLTNYNEAKRWVDVTNLIDYMILSFYAGNDWDWLENHDWAAAGPLLPDWGGWKFFPYDQDMCLQDVNADNSDISIFNKSVPDGIFEALLAFPDFQVLFRDRAYQHLFHDGALTPAKAAACYDLRAASIHTAIVGETVRWQPTSTTGPAPWDRDGEWTVERDYLMNTYFPQRPTIQMNQFRTRGWYPVEAPEMSQHGGAVEPDTEVLLTGPVNATIHYTLDGSDPRLPGGAVNPAALSFEGTTSQPLAITAATTLKARALTGSEWSAVNEATFYLTGTQPAASSNLTLSEIHYNPEGAGQGDAEFLEFANTGASAIDMTGVRIGGAVLFTFPDGIILLPGEQVVVAKDQTLFDPRYRAVSSPWYFPGIRLAGTYTGSLSNGGEEIIVVDSNDTEISTFTYDDNGAWPGRADEHGSSLELSDPAAAPVTQPAKNLYLGSTSSWRPSSEFHGSPGRLGSGPDNRVVINEILSAPLPPDTDFIELYNPGSSPQAIGGWFLSDTSADYRKFKIPAATSLAAGAFLVLDESHFNNPAHPGCLIPFGLGSTGDDVYLLQADSADNLLKFVDRVEFAAAPGAMTYGRAPDGDGGFDLVGRSTPGAANSHHLPQYATWLAQYFSAGSPAADTALAADPDHDGLSNFAEFALLLSPLVADGNPLALLPTAPGAPLEVTFAVRNDIPGLTAKLHTSTDLTLWDSNETFIERLSESPSPDGTTVVTARLTAAPGTPRAFIRLALDF